MADWEAAWEFSTGDELLIRWDSLGSISELGLHSRNPGSQVQFSRSKSLFFCVFETGFDIFGGGFYVGKVINWT